MIDAIKQLQEALAYAKFEDKDIKAAAYNLLDELDVELTGEEYEPGTAIEDAAGVLHDAIAATDSDKEERVAEAKAKADDAADESIEDPFEGLGEDE